MIRPTTELTPSEYARGGPSGLLSIGKPKGLSSHDVVIRVRKATQQRQIGHAGTLDPLASGVLVMCLGKATRVSEYVAEGRKVYCATVRFGAETDTQDGEGEIIATHDASGLTLAEVERALPAFRGAITQVPPMYSALKQDGQPLYRLARRGIEVEREPRAVTIYDLTVVGWQPPDLTLRITCSKGTYVRALAHDLGQALGVGAYLADLVREAVGAFRLEEALPLAALLDGAPWQEYLRPIQAGLAEWPGQTVDAEAARRILSGQAVALAMVGTGELGWACDEEGRFLAVLRHDPAAGLWRPHKVMGQNDASDL
jgi:tRNA pseudouridine55 synthase